MTTAARTPAGSTMAAFDAALAALDARLDALPDPMALDTVVDERDDAQREALLSARQGIVDARFAMFERLHPIV